MPFRCDLDSLFFPLPKNVREINVRSSHAAAKNQFFGDLLFASGNRLDVYGCLGYRRLGLRCPIARAGFYARRPKKKGVKTDAKPVILPCVRACVVSELLGRAAAEAHTCFRSQTASTSAGSDLPTSRVCVQPDWLSHHLAEATAGCLRLPCRRDHFTSPHLRDVHR